MMVLEDSANYYKTNNISDSRKYISFFFAIVPVLDPYVIANVVGIDIKLSYIYALIFLLPILIRFKISLDKSLLTLLTLLFLFNILSFIVPIQNRSFGLTLKVFFIWFFYYLIVSNLWKKINRELFVKYCVKISLFASIIQIIQFVALNLGFYNFWNGKIPFLSLSKYDHWSGMIDITGIIRVHSIFQEPSYIGIYMLPVLFYLLYKKSFFKSALVITACVLSTSSVAILGVVIVITYYIMSTRNIGFNSKKISFYIMILIIVPLVFYYLYSKNDALKNIFDYMFAKISMISSDLDSERMGSTRLRLLGNIGVFSEYNIWFKIFGTGLNQYPLIYSSVWTAYSSSVVTVILNFGILGILSLSSFCLHLFAKTERKFWIYPILFCVFSLVDLMWFNWYFFYILTWVKISSRK